MTSVPTRTGHKPDSQGDGRSLRLSGLDEMGKELGRLARTGLSRTRLQDALRREKSRFQILLGLPLIADGAESQAKLLERLTVEVALACQSLDEPHRHWATLLFGTEKSHHALAYSTRHMAAASAWAEQSTGIQNIDKPTESFDRRHREVLLTAVETALLAADKVWRREDLAERSRRGTLYELVGGKDGSPNADFLRRRFRVVSTFEGSRFARYSDWTFTDLNVRASGSSVFRVFTSSDSEVTLEALSPNVRHAQRLGVNTSGFQVWSVELLDLPPAGSTFTWSIRKRFGNSTSEPQRYLALSNSQPAVMDSGSFEARFGLPASERPERVVRFVNPKGQLPNLRGSFENCEPQEEGVYREKFVNLVPWHTHGLYWWWPEASL